MWRLSWTYDREVNNIIGPSAVDIGIMWGVQGSRVLRDKELESYIRWYIGPVPSYYITEQLELISGTIAETDSFDPTFHSIGFPSDFNTFIVQIH